MKVQRRDVTLLSAFVLMAAAALIGCNNDARPTSEAKRDTLEDQARSAIKEMQAKDPDLKDFLNSAYAYVVFPDVGEGALIIGGAHGRGIVYRNGQQIGWAEIQQATVGAQAGGQSYSELLVFQNETTFNKFKTNELTLEASAAAVALSAGASKNVEFKNGVAVFAMPRGGAMLKAAIGGQRFVYTPLGGPTTRSSSETQVEVKTQPQ